MNGEVGEGCIKELEPRGEGETMLCVGQRRDAVNMNDGGRSLLSWTIGFVRLLIVRLWVDKEILKTLIPKYFSQYGSGGLPR